MTDAITAQHFDGADAIVTGTPTFLTDINPASERACSPSARSRSW